MTKSSLFSIFSSAALALGLVGQAGATTLTMGGTAVAGEGLMTSVAGASTITFNGLTALPAGFSTNGATAAQSLVIGTTFSNKTPTADSSTYLTSGTGIVTDTLSASTKYFGFYWGSVDAYNTFSITDSMGKTFSITGTQLAAQYGAQADGDSSYFVNLYADGGSTFKSASFASTANSFEIDNVATATPEPGTVAMLAGGLMVVAGAMRRRKA